MLPIKSKAEQRAVRNHALIMEKIEDSVCDFMINVTPFPPTEKATIRNYIEQQIRKIAKRHNEFYTEDEITGEVDMIERMYLAYCRLNEHTYGDYSA